VANKKFQSNAQGGKKLSNFFNRFCPFFTLFYTFFQIFRNFSHFLTIFKHELARLVLPHLTYFTQIAKMAYATTHLNLTLYLIFPFVLRLSSASGGPPASGLMLIRSCNVLSLLQLCARCTPSRWGKRQGRRDRNLSNLNRLLPLLCL